MNAWMDVAADFAAAVVVVVVVFFFTRVLKKFVDSQVFGVISFGKLFDDSVDLLCFFGKSESQEKLSVERDKT